MTEALFWYGLAELAFSIAPGPAVFLVISHAIWRGFRTSLASICGILIVNIVYFILSALGVGAALAASPTVFNWIKVFGALYLVWCAIEIVVDLVQRSSQNTTLPQASNSNFAGFMRGVLIQASNVKNLVIFIAILPQFITPGANIEWQFFWLGVVSIAVELPVLLGYAFLASQLREVVHQSGYARSLDGVTATVFLLIAGSILVV